MSAFLIINIIATSTILCCVRLNRQRQRVNDCHVSVQYYKVINRCTPNPGGLRIVVGVVKTYSDDR